MRRWWTKPLTSRDRRFAGARALVVLAVGVAVPAVGPDAMAPFVLVTAFLAYQWGQPRRRRRALDRAGRGGDSG